MQYYVDEPRKRILTSTGISIVDPWVYAEHLFNDTLCDSMRCFESDDTLLYEYINHVFITSIEDNEPNPKEDDIDKGELLGLIRQLPRYSRQFDERLVKEIDFFEKCGRLGLVVSLIELIEKFKEDGVVWGVGRGSSCASLTMFVIGVNDVNPLDYNIPFSEMSKEGDY